MKEKKNFLKRNAGINAENRCEKALDILTKNGFIGGYIYNISIDSVGIDFFIFKHIKLNKNKIRVGLHLQIKVCEKEAKKYRSKYPTIPVYVINRNDTDHNIIAKKLWNVFCEIFENSIYYEYILKQKNVRP